jgi:hypothetical protein
MSPKIRRTQGIRFADDPTSLGHDVALSKNTAAEIKAALRVVDRAARDEDDRDLLMAALGLNAIAVYAALLAYSAAYFAWARHTDRNGGRNA